MNFLNRYYKITGAVILILIAAFIVTGAINAKSIKPDNEAGQQEVRMTGVVARNLEKTQLLAQKEPVEKQDTTVGLREIQSVLQLLREEYIQEVDSTELLSGAMDGIKGHLKFRKLDVKDIKDPVSVKRTPEANMRAFGSEYGKVLMKYGDKVTEEELVYSALKGMIRILQDKYKDPYTTAMKPEEYKTLQEQLNSRGFSGIGVFIEIDKKAGNTLMVVEPIEGTPAKEAGLKPGDHIIRINGVSTRGMSIESSSGRIRGPEGSTVTLTLQRKGVAKPFDVKVMRSSIVVNSLTGKMIGDIGYIKLRFFGDTTRDEFYKTLKELHNQGAKGLIVDLRNNGGGYINAAVQICSPFVKPGTVITSVVNYRKGTRDKHESYPSIQEDIPLVVLVNKFSASASEITAGCVQDLGLGVLIGTKTFGKGSVQTIHRIEGGGAIKYTSAHYLTPKGKDINKKGIFPDINVEMDPAQIGTKNDTQLNRALSYLKSKVSKN